MFKSDRLSVAEWIVLLIILAIPILNVIFAIYMFIQRKASETVRNFFIAYLVLYFLAWLGILGGVFNNLSGLFN
mgnify:CR=1 FL=1|jgi:hypothetical protein